MRVLVLLVGTNPLPNWVVAQATAQDPDQRPDKILLLYTKRTLAVANRLQCHLPQNITSELVELERHHGPSRIQSKLKSTLQRLLGEGNLSEARGEIHLNYTGGTKAMAVHTYRAIEEIARQTKGLTCRFSYLDASDFRLYFDDESGGNEPDDLRRSIALSPKDLFELHGCTFKTDNKQIFLKEAWHAHEVIVTNKMTPDHASKELPPVSNIANFYNGGWFMVVPFVKTVFGRK